MANSKYVLKQGKWSKVTLNRRKLTQQGEIAATSQGSEGTNSKWTKQGKLQIKSKR